MTTIENKTFDEERALYGSHDVLLKNSAFDGPADGESAFKESSDIQVDHVFCNLRYPFWPVSYTHLLGDYPPGKGSGVHSCHWKRGCGFAGKGKGHAGGDGLRRRDDRAGRQRKSLDFPPGGSIPERGAAGAEAFPGRNLCHDAPPCQDAGRIQRGLHRGPRDAQAHLLVYSGTSPFRKAESAD